MCACTCGEFMHMAQILDMRYGIHNHVLRVQYFTVLHRRQWVNVQC